MLSETTREGIINRAVMAADRAIREAAHGSEDELLLMTIKVAEAFANKAAMMARLEVHRNQITEDR